MTSEVAAVSVTGSRGASGVVLGLAAGLAFGAGGVFIKPLLEAGWSPAAAVLARISVAALVLVVPGLVALRFDLRPLWRAKWTVLLYSCLAIVGTQVAFYASIARIPVSMTLLIEYLAPILLVVVVWLRTRRSPQRVVLGGSVLALAGLVLVIGPGGDLDVLGLLYAGIAMVGVAVYYVVGARVDEDLPPVALAAAGFVIGAIVLAAVGFTGLLPLEVEWSPVELLGMSVPWFVPVLIVGLISTAFAYVAGIAAIARLGTRLASFLGLSEVVFAAIIGWILLGEVLSVIQILGGVLILAGIICIRLERPALSNGAAIELGVEPVPTTGAITQPR
ncbi:EamA family transporter [Agromyces atrinae]|uniref:Drug/metabolite transporter (DMT)-like permease n=1 Tax=Agromyces atrinae TaxID=592376 RepID=A0A4Q2M317_9MICO|nr:EamA family transporter [Agromyces atrinae]MCI2958956.1 EamA family transporter [Agromyces atrinae]NYD65817.1 drug/metabolite transporter (DMT)-like permease [Agromyces atrinae]RXZ86168.1 EamA/RhaT family transporter [Agromyces atrinae]